MSARHRWQPIALAVALGSAACGGGADDAQSSEQAATVRYDGVTIFRGIYFGEGVVAAHLPELHSARPAPNAAIVASRQRILAHIEASNARFFPEFAASIQSGDHLRVKQALHTANDYLRDAISAVAHVSAADAVAIGAAARADEIVIDTYTVQIAYYFLYMPIALSPQGARGLPEEVVVDTIATRLGAVR